MLRTEQFTLNSDSKFSFNISYEAIRTDSIDKVLTEGKSIKFTVELVSEETGTALAEFASVQFSKNNIAAADKAAFDIDCNTIKTGQYFLRVKTETNIDAVFAIVEVQTQNSVQLMKDGRQVSSAVNNMLVTSYDLAQNYPNPFNPTTTIKYQLPTDGMVTLKIYDALGKEITTLVNETKTAGRYEVQFNASNLASGIYFYQINVNDFSSTKKLILMK